MGNDVSVMRGAEQTMRRTNVLHVNTLDVNQQDQDARRMVQQVATNIVGFEIVQGKEYFMAYHMFDESGFINF